jgi:hypothetical protein
MVLAATGAGSNRRAWHLAGGIAATDCVAAYDPQLAASLAASYTNINNPGAYTAAPGVAPTLAPGVGWTFDGATQYLTTGITPADGTWSMILGVTGWTPSGTSYLCGSRTSANQRFYLGAAAGSGRYLYGNGSIASGSLYGATPLSKVLAIAAQVGYLNAAPDAAIGPWVGGAATRDIYIGCENEGVPVYYSAAVIHRLAVYSRTLLLAEVAAVTLALIS